MASTPVLFHSWTDPRVEVRPSPIGGLGTFARAPITAGKTVFRWGGVFFTPAEVRAGLARTGTFAAIDDNLYLAAPPAAPPDPSNFTNHSCDPNLWLSDAVSLVARRDIVPGEDLTSDYATLGANDGYVAAWSCRCASPLCRGRLTGRDWRLPDLQARYSTHFSPFLNRRIAALRGGP